MSTIEIARPTAVLTPWLKDQPVGEQQGERQAVGVDALDVGNPRERVGVECEERSGSQRARTIRRPGIDQGVSGQAGQREAEEQGQVEREDGRSAQPEDGRRQDRRHDQRLRKRERVLRGIEDVGVEQPQRIAGQLVHRPTP